MNMNRKRIVAKKESTSAGVVRLTGQLSKIMKNRKNKMKSGLEKPNRYAMVCESNFKYG